MADNKRRGEDADDERLDDEFDAAGDDAEDAEEPVSRGGTATRSRARAESADRPKTRTETEKVGLFGRIARFIREVVAELRKVIWPTRKELLTYTAVVVAFVTVVTALVVGFDYVFAKGVLWVFGNPS
ncbi:preprotein translocase subunit SecE [Micromonospora thermarum]|uniref:Protein translocase subunit SecE n=1 Tax=Micromonospora thermarum TaxID=2720024 RepID=A0ABX0ZIJ6_9ACTN|nr:preprotein translocase subunit SecE [Micromonospora thermarum]NJP35826.1 preprotein translocase subunit SecE [Micromonospora thermarum]